MGEASFLQGLMTPEYWEALEQSETYWLLIGGMAIVKTPLLMLGLGNDL